MPHYFELEDSPLFSPNFSFSDLGVPARSWNILEQVVQVFFRDQLFVE